MDWTLEVVVLPVSDIDRAIEFYRDKIGFNLDHDTRTDQMHVVQLTPRGSGCSIVFGDLPAQREMPAGSMRGLQLVVSDAHAARQELVDRGVEVSEIMQFSPEEAATRGNHYLSVVARLKPGATIETADSDMQAIAKRLSEQYPETNRDFSDATVVPIREQVLGDTRIQVIALMTAAAVIVLIACANLASLLLARASVRRGEYAVRLSLGATRGRLTRQVLVEAIRRAGSLDGEKLRTAIARMDLNTVYGAFRVDQDGVQIAHRMVMFQWQDGKKVIVWPEELAPDKPRFPTPPWSQRP